MAGQGGGAYINGRYVANAGAKGAGKKGGGKGGKGENGRATGWVSQNGEEREFKKKVGDEDTVLERKFDIDILQPGESRVGYMFNMKVSRHYDEGGRCLSGVLLYFVQRDGITFRCTFVYRPYFFVKLRDRENFDQVRDILAQRFYSEGVFAEVCEREDLDMEDHIIGRKRKLIKLSFENEDGLNKARRDLMTEMKRAKTKDNFSFEMDSKKPTSVVDSIVELYEYDVPYICRISIDNVLNCGKWFSVSRNAMATGIDNIWDTQCTVKALDEMVFKPGLRIFAWDIECTKEPLKFPDSAKDRITLISIMVDGSGFLIVNRTEVSEDIHPLEYTPKPEYEGIFETFNEPDEASLLRRFFALLRETNPHVTVTFNGDFFDMPFVTNRAKAYNMNWAAESGIDKMQGEDFYAGKWIAHLDCFAWVQRDSYLPCGARGLKAVTRYKLKYDPVELDPEDMTPFAKERPQELAAYSVSDAVATYYLYMKYIHDFIFALCSIIPYGPDDVLRRGSGTLCESLLMNQAFHARVLFPNKHIDEPLEYHPATGRLIEQSTYEGARVECMRVGIYRANIKETFQLEPGAFQVLLDDLKKTVDFFLVEEEKVKLEDVANYDEILAEVERQLRALCDPDKVAAQIGRRTVAAESPSKRPSSVEDQDDYNLRLVEYEFIEGAGGVKSGGKRVRRATERVVKDDYPMIYHLDVGAMYPNIILSNRLQPSAIVSPEECAACSYNDPSNNCQRRMDWKWRGELYMATRADVKAIMNEMEHDKRRYNQKDRDTGEVKRVKWSELMEKERVAEIIKAVRTFTQKAYGRLKSSIYEDRNDIVCQRENPFYVNTVLNFRDRRYLFKKKTKEWNGKLEKAQEAGDLVKAAEAKDMVLLYDSLQLAHKCILNSFYGYVMRKGARWHSMKMAGIVTFTGSNLIREAREFCEMVGLPIELDTDGIWCMLPKSFPDTFKIKMKNGKELKMPYPNCVLNYRVHAKYTNHQYQERAPTGEWVTRSENSIFFEIDGPYLAMVLPASTEEDRMLKKRYAVFNFDGSIAELKGFEIKRRGELKLIQVFQEEVFPEFLKGTTKQEVYACVGNMANRWLDVIESKGKSMTDDEVIYFFSECKSMSKSVEASGNNKSVQITTARRLADFLGVDSILKSEGISCHMFIACKPHNASTTERAIPVKIFAADYEVKKQWLRKWLEDPTLNDFDMRSIVDWEYYKLRLVAVFQKLISIPASYQFISNPCPRVKVPDWLKKRVAEQTDRFQQRSLALYMKKAPSRGLDDAEATKRKLCDLEDLAGGLNAPRGAKKRDHLDELPIVEFGKGAKRWLDSQRLRWAMPSAIRQGNGPKVSIFDEGVTWAQISSEAMHASWHIVAVEQKQAPPTSSTLGVGDAVLAQLDDDEGMSMEDTISDRTERRASIIGFLGGLVRVALDADGSERLLKRSSVRPAREDGLYVVWALTEPGGLHRFEVQVKRRVILGLAADFSPEGARRVVRPKDLAKGLRVWPKHPEARRIGPGLVRTASPEIGLAAVTWASDLTEIVLSEDLECQCGSVSKVLRDAPRNLKHGCLVELEMLEDEFQEKVEEGALGDQDAGWPQVDAVYEGEQPLDFDLLCRLGPLVRLVAPERADELRRGRCLRLAPDDLTQALNSDMGSGYLPGQAPPKNIYLHLCFDKARPSRAFCGLFSPTLSEAWVCFGGLDSAHAEDLRHGLESLVSESLSPHHICGGIHGSLPEAVQVQATFLTVKSPTPLVQWVDQKLQEVRRRDGGNICVLCSQLSTGELRGSAPSFWLEQRLLRHLTGLRYIPICRAPFVESDTQFPALDWPRWIAKRFVAKVPRLYQWWRTRLSLCRAAGTPVCNVPELAAAAVPAALDILFSRQLRKDGQLRWASKSMRPDLGDISLSLIDSCESSLESTNWLLHGDELTEGRGGGQMNHPGVYRSICLNINLRAKICVCALQHARYLSDLEGGELSRKLIRKVAASNKGESEGGASRNMDHTSEVSVTSLESLVTMVQSIAEARDAKAAEISVLKRRWAAQASNGETGIGVRDTTLEDDESFLARMHDAGLENAVLAAQLEELRFDCTAQERLLDGLYGWLASPSSLLYDPALLRRVHQYMDRVMSMFMGVLQRNGCTVIYASYNRVLFATGKLRVLPDIRNFWEAFCDNVKASKALEPLGLHDVPCLSELYFGMLWMDPANYSGVPIDPETLVVTWRSKGNWKLAEFLPPAVRPYLELYTGELLVVPQQELERRYVRTSLTTTDDAPAADVEGEDGEGDDVGDMDMDRADVAVAGGGAVAPPREPASAGGSDPQAQTAQALEGLMAFIQTVFFVDIEGRVIKYVRGLQEQQAADVPVLRSHRFGGGRNVSDLDSDAHYDDGSSDGDEDIDDSPGARERQLELQRRLLKEKWSFPQIPGRRTPPGTVDFEFMRSIVQIFMLEDCLKEQAGAMRDRLCQILKVSSFGSGVVFANPRFPLFLREVSCPFCCTASHVDITSHPHEGPGLWICSVCSQRYDKEMMEARLVGVLEGVVQAWQSQEVVCVKCKRMNPTKLQVFCECFGRYGLRYKAEDCQLVLRMLRSLVGPHELQWLGQMLEFYEVIF